MPMTNIPMTSKQMTSKQATSKSKLPLYAVLAVCIAPMLAAYIAYYGFEWQPNTETTNYGELLTGQAAMADLPSARTLDGKPFNMSVVYKKWVYVSVDNGACTEPCAKRLYTHRQLKAITGRERDRVARVWFVLDDAPIKPELLNAHPDLTIVRINASDLNSLPVHSGQGLTGHTWLIDPLGRPMMRYSAEPNPDKMKKDMSKLLYASKNWQHNK